MAAISSTLFVRAAVLRAIAAEGTALLGQLDQALAYPAVQAVGRKVAVRVAFAGGQPGKQLHGLVDVLRYRPLARLGYADYTCVERVFSMAMPTSVPPCALREP